MVGLILFTIVGLWIWACVALTGLLLRKVNPQKGRSVFAFIVFAVLLVLPVIDEIIGGFQFKALCAKDAKVRLGVEHPAGRTTRFSARPSNERIAGTFIPIIHSRFRYHDVVTNELVAEHDIYEAKGGVLIRIIGLYNSPLTIDPPICSGEQDVALSVALGFKVIN